jgi:hypothetical protein
MIKVLGWVADYYFRLKLIITDCDVDRKIQGMNIKMHYG